MEANRAALKERRDEQKEIFAAKRASQSAALEAELARAAERRAAKEEAEVKASGDGRRGSTRNGGGASKAEEGSAPSSSQASSRASKKNPEDEQALEAEVKPLRQSKRLGQLKVPEDELEQPFFDAQETEIEFHDA